MPVTRDRASKFKVGDWVKYPRYPEPAHAQIIELRGPLAPGGEQVNRLRRVYDWGEVHEFEQAESVLVASEAPEHQPQPRPESEWALWTG
jgi:predicted esterase